MLYGSLWGFSEYKNSIPLYFPTIFYKLTICLKEVIKDEKTAGEILKLSVTSSLFNFHFYFLDGSSFAFSKLTVTELDPKM